MQHILDLIYGQFGKEVKLALNPFASFNLHACVSTIVPVIFSTRFVLSMPFFITFSQAVRCLLLITAFNLLSLALTVFLSFKGFTFGKA